MKQEKAVSPPISISSQDTRSNKTGSWRYLRPLHREQVAPCRQACPAGTDIPQMLNLLRAQKLEEAYQVLKRHNPLPGICGRVCYHPCEDACNRQHFDEAASIQAVERFLADSCVGLQEAPAATCLAGRVAVVGSGPAGLSCAYFLAKSGLAVRVFEATGELGGMLRQGIPRYRLPRHVLDREIDAIKRLGVEFEVNCEIGRQRSLEELQQGFDAVFVASGAHLSRDLGLDQGDGCQIQSGLEFLKRVNAKQPVRVGEKVVVIGGGNTALDAARTSLRLGARPTIIYRRTRTEMPAVSDEIEEAEQEGVRLQFLAAPVSVERIDDAVQVTFTRMSSGAPDASGRPRPVPISDSEFSERADLVLTAVGEHADLEFIDPEQRSMLLGSGLSSGSQGAAGLFLGGDAQTGPATVVEAIAAGRRAAAEILAYLHRKDPTLKSAAKDESDVVGFERINTAHFSRRARFQGAHLPVSLRIDNFKEVVAGLSLQEAVSEACRCFSCGTCTHCDNCWVFCPEGAITRDKEGNYRVDLNYCKGCGICVEECPRGIIALIKEKQ